VQVEGEIISVGMEKKAIAQILGMATLKTSMLRLTIIRHAVIMGCSTLQHYKQIKHLGMQDLPCSPSCQAPVPSCNARTLEAQ
jgi:hypothetical protein